MSRKKLIAIGCSFTEHAQRDINYKKIYPFDVWPQHLADKLDMECVNLARGSMGNEYILILIRIVISYMMLNLVGLLYYIIKITLEMKNIL